ncbi:MAG: alpha/beta hydrolase [Chloroflexota bacterium]
MSKPKIIYFAETSEKARHYHDDSPTSTRIPIVDLDMKQERQENEKLYAAHSQQAREAHCRSVTEQQFEQTRYLKIEPKKLTQAFKDKVGIFFFGGGFIVGSPELDLIVSAPIANELGLVLLSPDYRLAPEHPFPAALDDCFSFYKHVVAEYGAENVVLMGESAGGNLALATVLKAHQTGVLLPQAVMLMSPATDMSGDAFSATYFYQEDPELWPENVDYVKRVYAPNTPNDDPLVSPHFATYGSWFPPTLMTTGTKDALRPQLEKTAVKMAHSGVDVTVHIWEDLWHVFEYNPEIEEAAKSIQQIAAFIRPYLR